MPPRSLRYRITLGVLAVIGIAIVIAVTGKAISMIAEGRTGVAFLLVALAGVGVIPIALYWNCRQAVAAEEAGISVRSLLRTRTFPWRDVQGVVVEADRSQVGGRTAKLYVAGLSRPVALKSLSIGGRNAALDETVESLQRRWVQGRGDEWASIAKTQREIHERQVFGESPWRTAWHYAGIAGGPMMLGFVVNFWTGHSVPLLNFLFNLPTVWGVPLVVFAVTFVMRRSKLEAMRRK